MFIVVSDPKGFPAMLQPQIARKPEKQVGLTDPTGPYDIEKDRIIEMGKKFQGVIPSLVISIRLEKLLNRIHLYHACRVSYPSN